MELLKPSRRGFIGLLGALAVAPAIIRTPGLLMPIKPSLVTNPCITAEMIATAFAQELYHCGSRRAIMPTMRQLHVDTAFTDQDRTIPLEQFVKQFIRPAALAMSRVAKGVGGPVLQVPVGVYDGAIGHAGGFAVRFLQDYSIGTDKMIARFDIISS